MSDPSSAHSAALGHLTYSDLIHSVDELTPKSGDQVASWKALRGICEELQKSEQAAPITSGHHWLLREVEIEGYRGASTNVKLVLDPHPGVTIIHGPNGAGKSTLAEAVRAALWGDPGRSFIGETRKPGALWKPVELNKLSTEATVRISLVDEFASHLELNLTTTISEGVAAPSVAADGRLIDSAAGTTIVISNRDALHAALISAPPVLAYADMANDLRELTQLREWLTASLGMGPLLAGVESVVESRAESSTELKRKLEAGRKQAQEMLALVDKTAVANGYPLHEDRDVPIFESEPAKEQWLAGQDISDRTKSSDLYEQTDDDNMSAFAEQLKQAFEELDDVAASQARFTSALGELLESADQAKKQPAGNEECPACGSSEHDWREHSRLVLEGAKDYTAKARALTALVQRSSSELLVPAGRVVRIVSAAAPKLPGIAEIREAFELASTELAPGAMWKPDALPNLRKLARAVGNPDAKSLRGEAVAKSNGLHDWQCRRWEALEPYLDLWTTTREDAARADDWKATKSRVTSLTKHFRDKRNSTLSEGIDQNVAALLKEFGLRIGALRITKTDADFGLTDLNGKSVALGELSAGQRNAVILAPMLATAESSLFGFTLLDDPVHAFDEFRVDHLAEILAKIGEKQRLIVTTHDGRLVEQLRVHCGASFELLEISRDPISATIKFESREDPVTELLNSAAEIIGLMKSQTEPGPDWSLVESLLRMSVDEALTSCFHRSVVVLDGVSRRARISSFEALDTLDDRFEHLAQNPQIEAADQSRLSELKVALEPHLTRWNGAIHKNQQMSPLTIDEVIVQKEAAKAACKAIGKVGRK
jgi:energy-coupling factor transporter ATP-binding protein EcfA2